MTGRLDTLVIPAEIVRLYLRIFIGQLGTETNTFSPMPTTMSSFREFCLTRNASLDKTKIGFLSIFRKRAEADGHEVVETIAAFAQPAGRTLKPVFESLRDEILSDLRVAGDVDIVLLGLHGAMVAHDYDDCEADILRRIRDIVPGAVIGAVLDPHCHLSCEMVQAADFLVLGKEYPHTDFGERAHELYELCHRTARGELKPVAALVDTGIVGFFPTYAAPMKDIVAELKAVETRPGILSAGIVHGFPWADVADVGTRILVYADNDEGAAIGLANAFAARLYHERHALSPNYPSIAASLDRAQQLDGSIVLGDFADNPGGGGPGDSTYILRAMLERGSTDAAVGALWDPVVAQICAEVGIGARLDIRLGGKSGPTSGMPLDLTVDVMNVVQDFAAPGLNFQSPMGCSAWLHTNGIDITICSVRAQIFHPGAFTGLGVRLDNKRLTVVKSAAHFQAAFAPIADHLWQVAAPGTMSADFASLPYTLRGLDYFPRVDDPWAIRGRAAPLFVGASNRRATSI